MNTTRRNLRPFGYNGPIPHLVATDDELRTAAPGPVTFGTAVEVEGRVWKWSPIQGVWTTIENPESRDDDDPELATVTTSRTK